MLQEKAGTLTFDIAFTHACSIFWLLAMLSLQAVPRRPAILVPCRLQCQLDSSQSSTAEILMSCQHIIRQFSCQAVFALWLRSLDAPVVCGPARRPVLCIGPTRLAIFLNDPRAVVKLRTLDPRASAPMTALLLQILPLHS